ncbi:MAG: crossover junction endodeoxyribonuclease RuvC [Puniceicoccales bacterium]|jgi:crossover junction endodeoxyribonuclease RuvC|nr:crossover junction endodeoxyribonuclease RuvC [Puniceicoccales bacterium]
MCAVRSNRRAWTDFINKGKVLPAKVDWESVWVPGKGHFHGKILGIDPSLRGTGLAVIDVGNREVIDLLFSQTVKVLAKESLAECTYRIFSTLQTVIERYQPTVCAAEETIYVQNFQTAQIMGIARGAILTAIGSCHLPLFEYAPLRIKQALCGYGRASKEQVGKMVQAILKIQMDVGFDETDAAAAAICCFFTERSLANFSHKDVPIS